MFSRELLYTYALSFIVTSAFSLALFYAGAFGGADAKALICISLAIPVYPEHLLHPSHGSFFLFFPIAAFTNAVFLAALSVFYSLLRNFLWKSRTKRGLFDGLEKESIGRKILTLLCGYKIPITEFKKKKHVYPLEDISLTETGESRRRLLIFPQDEGKEEIIERISKATEESKLENDVWITPGLPLLIFITTGLIITLAFGDIVWFFCSAILRGI